MTMTAPVGDDLFASALSDTLSTEAIGDGAVILRRFVAATTEQLLAQIAAVGVQAPFRHMVTPGGYRMSVAMTSCGALGWITDRKTYRYAALDPDSHQHWPVMPTAFLELASEAANAAGYSHFAPDSCLINRYAPGSKLSLHQDRDELDMSQPIVSVSLGLSAVFQLGGRKRSDPIRRHRLDHGDVVVWGGASRLFHHGIAVLKPGNHPLTGEYRYNLTFRKAG
jgi:alkylated DNA repair protein (DNA oxidative demethylase)